ncbi:FlgD immunoglobulin-like domain containing protein [Streptomyces sp. NPDC051940]|uniref:FlgD immunoglobulin-like domain containing protein n=1 Tax=Streptomyces sp. NPDC051940 TaxID=3155675 RepID=UPI003439891D
MSRHLLTFRTTHRGHRPHRALATTAIAVALAAGTATALPVTAAHAADAAEVLIPAPAVYSDGPETLLATGGDGVLHREGGQYLWTTTYNRTTKTVWGLSGLSEDAIVPQHDASNRITYTKPRADGGTDVIAFNAETPQPNLTVTVPPEFLNPVVAGGWALATVDSDGDGVYEMAGFRPNSSLAWVQLPPGATTGAKPLTYGGAEGRALIGYTNADGTPGYGVVTAPFGVVTPLPVEGTPSSMRITSQEVSWFSREGGPAVHIQKLGSTAPPRVVPLDVQSPDSKVQAFLVSDNVLWYEEGVGTLHLTPYAGNDTARDLLTDVETAVQGYEGRGELTVLAKDAEGLRGIHNFSIDGLGLVWDLPMRQAPRVQTGSGSVEALSLAGGRLRHATALSGTTTLHGKDIGTGADPVDGPKLPDFGGQAAGRFADGGDEGLARLVADPGTGKDVLVSGDDPEDPVDSQPLPGADGRILDVSPEFVLYRAADRTYVVDTARDRIVREAPGAATLEHDTLLVPSQKKPGSVDTVDLRTGEVTGSVWLGTACVPSELQSSGSLLYWSCAGQDTAGVRDRATGRAWPAPATGTLLGDRFLAARNAGSLKLTGLKADGTTADLGTVDSVKPGDPGRTWTLDPAAGKLAWVDTDDTIHVTAPQQAVSPLTVADSATPATLETAGWNGAWWLSKPAASWTLTLTNRSTGAVVRTWTGEATRGTVKVTWDGTSESGTRVENGAYTWDLTATPADGSGDAATATGVVRVTG